jgi:pyruvate formate lyase activating enzyme
MCSKIESAYISNSCQIIGKTFNIQFHSTEDGPGIRTTLFFKGCPMRCPWCHNPEGINPYSELVWYDVRCIGARDCLAACPNGALHLTPEGMVIDRNLCDVCGECEKVCPAAAFEVMGTRRTVDELASMVLRDRIFYQKSGGGVTFSGGEVSLQADFVLKLMTVLKGEGIHIALDTCGGSNWNKLKPLVSLSDLVLYDLKLMDPDQHLKHTGLPLSLILENAKHISEMGKPMWIRTPVIPGYTDSEENIGNVSRFIKHHLPTVERYDLLVFNNTCSVKYNRLGRNWTLEGKDLVPGETIEKLTQIAKTGGLDMVRWSGLIRDNPSK